MTLNFERLENSGELLFADGFKFFVNGIESLGNNVLIRYLVRQGEREIPFSVIVSKDGEFINFDSIPVEFFRSNEDNLVHRVVKNNADLLVYRGGLGLGGRTRITVEHTENSVAVLHGHRVREERVREDARRRRLLLADLSRVA